MNISKELLSEVLNCKVNSCFIDNDICSYENVVYEDISIYELAYKCKLFAFSKGYEIVQLAYTIKIYKNGYEVYCTNTKLFDMEMFFRAVEWVFGDIK
jgi:RNA recognition motif-containing protein